jgi:hypothetical protein
VSLYLPRASPEVQRRGVSGGSEVEGGLGPRTVLRRHQILHDLVPVLLLMLGFQRGGVGGADRLGGVGGDAGESQDVDGSPARGLRVKGGFGQAR